MLVLPAAACAAASMGPGGPAAVSPEDLLAGAPLAAERDPPGLIDARQVLAVSDEMEAFLDRFVDPRDQPYFKLRQLVFALINDETFGLDYGQSTRTAAETFRTRTGNCLSFSNLFVALARQVGLDAQYQEVDIPPDWTREGGAFVLNRHVNVWVDLGPAGYHAVDFNIEDFRTGYDRRTISDARAFAHFFNNMGVERLQAGDLRLAVAYFRRALIDNDRRFAPAWTNLGILYLRAGEPVYAEAAFLQALEASPFDLVAMSNLAGFYAGRGDHERAESYRKKVVRHRNKNPYYRFSLARELFLSGDYDAAIKHLRFAIRKRGQEDQFYFLLGMCYLQKGDADAARRWLDEAERVAASEALKENYSHKIDLLLSGSRDD